MCYGKSLRSSSRLIEFVGLCKMVMNAQGLFASGRELGWSLDQIYVDFF